MKMWGGVLGPITHVEILDWELDFNPDAWNPLNLGQFDVANSGTESVYFINNHMKDFGRYAFNIEGGDADDIRIIGNLVDSEDGYWEAPDDQAYGVFIEEGKTTNGSHVQDVIVANNIFMQDNLKQCFLFLSGVPLADQPIDMSGVKVFTNNTCVALASNAKGGVSFSGASSTDDFGNYVFKNNIFYQPNSTDWLLDYNHDGIESILSDNNVFVTACASGCYRSYDGSYSTLSAWQSGSSLDGSSDDCTPTFVSASDYHLQTSDSCAQEAGVSMSGYITEDYDGDSRPQGSLWDIGADEYESGYSPPTGACCDLGCSETLESACGGIWEGPDTTCDPDPCAPPEGDAVDGFAEGVTLSGVSKD